MRRGRAGGEAQAAAAAGWPGRGWAAPGGGRMAAPAAAAAARTWGDCSGRDCADCDRTGAACPGREAGRGGLRPPSAAGSADAAARPDVAAAPSRCRGPSPRPHPRRRGHAAARGRGGGLARDGRFSGGAERPVPPPPAAARARARDA